MYIGERFEKDGKTYEVTSVFGSNYGFKEVPTSAKVEVPVFNDDEPKEVKETKEEPKEEEKPVVRRGRKKST